MCDATTASNSKTATDFTSIAGVVIRGRRAEPSTLARWSFLMQPIRNPAPILSLSGCSVWIGRIRHRANKQGKLCLF